MIEQLIVARFSCSRFGLLSCHRHCWKSRLTFDPKIQARTEVQREIAEALRHLGSHKFEQIEMLKYLPAATIQT